MSLLQICWRPRRASSSLRLRRREAAHETRMGAPDGAATICVFGDSHCLAPRHSGGGVLALVFFRGLTPTTYLGALVGSARRREPRPAREFRVPSLDRQIRPARRV